MSRSRSTSRSGMVWKSQAFSAESVSPGAPGRRCQAGVHWPCISDGSGTNVRLLFHRGDPGWLRLFHQSGPVGIGYAHVAPPPRQQGTSSLATINSGMYEAHSAAMAASSTSVPKTAGSSKIILDVSTESWASDILNQSQEMSESSPLRSGVICRNIFSTSIEGRQERRWAEWYIFNFQPFPNSQCWCQSSAGLIQCSPCAAPSYHRARSVCRALSYSCSLARS